MSLLAGIALVVIGAASPAPVDVHVSLNPPEIPFFRQSTFSIVVEAPADFEVRLPDMRKKFGDLPIDGEPTQSVVTLKHGIRRTVASYVLDPVKPGDYPIQPVEVTWGKDGRITVPSPALRVRDATPAEEASLARFEPIVLPATKKSRMSEWMLWAGAAAVLALAAAAIAAYFLRKRRGRGEPEVIRHPWEVARDRLSALGARGFASDGPFYVELSDILRRYMEGRFRLHAPERTTPEFLSEAASSGLFSAEHQLLLEAVLRHADRVKFARHEPGEVETEQDFNEVRRFIEETVPKMATPAEEAAA
jgi:hypothetical protein